MRPRGGPDSPLQSLEKSEHSEQRNKPQYRQGHPNDDLPRPILLPRVAAAHLRLDFSIPFPDDAFRVGLHPSFPFLACSAVISSRSIEYRDANKSRWSVSSLIPPNRMIHPTGRLGSLGKTG